MGGEGDHVSHAHRGGDHLVANIPAM
jgi:hypothetical protein